MTEQLERLQVALADRYAVQRELGRGGMATVYLATDLRHDRPVALKVLDPALAALLGADRFLTEIVVTANLQHPHILPLYDSGSAAGLVYYVTPYVEGGSLRERLAHERELPIEDAVRITTEVASGLEYAHRRGILHRDIKPENILLQEGQALIGDFGIALAVHAAGGHRLTEGGLSLGTPQYMSIEQALGELDLDARSDLYSLACVLYEMLVGEPPHAGPHPEAVLARKALDPPRPLRTVRPGVSPGLEQAILRALARAPADRFATVAEFAAAITERGDDHAAPAPESVAVLPFVNMSPYPENEFFADGITEDIITALAKVERLHVASRTSSFAYKGHDQDVRQVGRQLNVDAVLEGSVRKAGNRLRVTAQLVSVTDGYHVWSERYDRDAGDVFAIQDEIARAIVAALKGRLGDSPAAPLVKRQTDNPDAYSHFIEGRYFLNQRGVGLAKALECFQRATAEDPGYAAAYAGLADAHTLLAWYGFVAPRDALPMARSAALRSLEIDPQLAEGYTSLAYVKLHWDWDWAGAERDFRRSIAITGTHAPTHQWYSEYLMAIGRVEEALEEAKRAQVLEPLGLIITTRLGDAWYCVRQHERAIHECRRAIEMDPTFVPAHIWLGLAHLQIGRAREAVRIFENARSLPGAGPSLALACCGFAYARAGRTDDARDVLRQLEELARQRHVSSFDVALVWLGLGRREDALASLERAADERACWLPRLLGDPIFDELRAEPRFHELLATMGLPARPAPPA